MNGTTPKLTADGRLTLSQLVETIDSGVIGWWNSQYSDRSKHIVMFPFKAEFIKDLTQHSQSQQRGTNRIITYRKVRKELGSLSSSPFSGTQEARPRLREEKVVVDDNGNAVGLKIFGRWYDVLLRFDCFAPTWTEAVQLEEDFDFLMDLFTGFIMKSGINKLMYRGTFSDAFHYETDYYYESIHYYFRLERHYISKHELVREFEVNMNNVYQTIVNANNS